MKLWHVQVEKFQCNTCIYMECSGTKSSEHKEPSKTLHVYNENPPYKGITKTSILCSSNCQEAKGVWIIILLPATSYSIAKGCVGLPIYDNKWTVPGHNVK